MLRTFRGLTSSLQDLDRNIHELEFIVTGGDDDSSSPHTLLHQLRRKRCALAAELDALKSKEESRRIAIMARAQEIEDEKRDAAVALLQRVSERVRTHKRDTECDRRAGSMLRHDIEAARHKKVAESMASVQSSVAAKAERYAAVRKQRHSVARHAMASRALVIISPRSERLARERATPSPPPLVLDRRWLEPKATPAERAKRLARDAPTLARPQPAKDFTVLNDNHEEASRMRLERACESRWKLKSRGLNVSTKNNERLLAVDERLDTVAEGRVKRVEEIITKRHEREQMVSRTMDAQKDLFKDIVEQRSTELAKKVEQATAHQRKVAATVGLAPLRRCLQHAERLLAVPRPDTTPFLPPVPVPVSVARSRGTPYAAFRQQGPHHGPPHTPSEQDRNEVM